VSPGLGTRGCPVRNDSVMAGDIEDRDRPRLIARGERAPPGERLAVGGLARRGGSRRREFAFRAGLSRLPGRFAPRGRGCEMPPYRPLDASGLGCATRGSCGCRVGESSRDEPYRAGASAGIADGRSNRVVQPRNVEGFLRSPGFECDRGRPCMKSRSNSRWEGSTPGRTAPFSFFHCSLGRILRDGRGASAAATASRRPQRASCPAARRGSARRPSRVMSA